MQSLLSKARPSSLNGLLCFSWEGEGSYTKMLTDSGLLLASVLAAIKVSILKEGCLFNL